MSELVPVRPEDGFPVVALARYLRKAIPDLGDAPLSVWQFAAGRSNPTYLLRAGEWTAVLRRPPAGPVPPRAHDMAREYGILERLHPVYSLAPRPHLFCADPGLLGVPFYLMEFRRGLVVDGMWPPSWKRTASVCRRVTESVVDALVALHAVDYEAAGLAEFGRPLGFLTRQLHGWTRRHELSRVDDIPEAEGVIRWLMDRVPASGAPALVHNDFKLNNLVLDASDPTRVVAVLDWEMCTVGDPLVDIGALLAYWPEPGEERVPGIESVSVHSLPEFVSRRELLQLYARKSGRDVGAIAFYLVYGLFKTAVICQQLYHRWQSGRSADERLRLMGPVARHLMRQAERAARGETLP